MQQNTPEPGVRQTARADGPAPDIHSAQDTFANPPHPEEGAIGEAQTVQVASGLPRMLLTITVNLLVLAEVFIAMYFAAKNPAEITPIFFKVLFSLLIPTLILSSVAKRLIARRGKR